MYSKSITCRDHPRHEPENKVAHKLREYGEGLLRVGVGVFLCALRLRNHAQRRSTYHFYQGVHDEIRRRDVTRAGGDGFVPPAVVPHVRVPVMLKQAIGDLETMHD